MNEDHTIATGTRVRVVVAEDSEDFAGISVGMTGTVDTSIKGISVVDMDDWTNPGDDAGGYTKWALLNDQLEVIPEAPRYTCPQAQTVLRHLNEVGEISGMEADNLYRVVDLPKRISELRQAGALIASEWRKDHTGKRYKRYFLVGQTGIAA